MKTAIEDAAELIADAPPDTELIAAVDPLSLLSLLSLLQGLFRSLMAGCAPQPETLHEFLTEKVPPFRARRRLRRIQAHIARNWKATGGDPARLGEVTERTLAAIREGHATIELIRGCYADVKRSDAGTEDFGD